MGFIRILSQQADIHCVVCEIFMFNSGLKGIEKLKTAF